MSRQNIWALPQTSSIILKNWKKSNGVKQIPTVMYKPQYKKTIQDLTTTGTTDKNTKLSLSVQNIAMEAGNNVQSKT